MQFRYLHKLDPLRSTTKLTGAKPDFSGHLKQKVRFSPYDTFAVLSISYYIGRAD
jgi:hypothetical protein